MSGFSYGLFARQVPSVTVVQAAVQKLLSFWTAPLLVALSPCLRNDPTAGAGGLTGGLEPGTLKVLQPGRLEAPTKRPNSSLHKLSRGGLVSSTERGLCAGY